ncbi:MAG: methyltransferase family protein [Thermoplasmatota archaeon]
MSRQGRLPQPVLLSLLPLVLGYLADRRVPPAALPDDVDLSGWVTVSLGLVAVVWALSEQMKRGNNPEVNAPTVALVASGPYRYSRNPVYVGFLVAQVGCAIVLGTIWGLGSVLLSAYLIHRYVVLPEEAMMADRFGETYEQYRDRVRRWL